uniref:Uncharacterized protein n=1 Tax=Romanomermis culicivorax TaxID=13658 RepID=A0A915I4T7_ROMCU
MDEHHQAFNGIKKSLMILPFLLYRMYDVKAQFIIQTDANIPKSTLNDHCVNASLGKRGHPTTFSAEEEQSFVEAILVMADWGFPMNVRQLKSMNYFRKWVLAHFIPNKKASTMVKCSINKAVLNHGSLMILFLDEGGCFTTKLIKEFANF